MNMIKTIPSNKFDSVLSISNRTKNFVILFLPSTYLLKQSQDCIDTYVNLYKIYKDFFNFYIVDLDKSPDLIPKYGVSNVPTVHIFDTKNELVAYNVFYKPSLDHLSSFLNTYK